MVVSVGSDHAGFGLKMKMLEVIRGWGYEVVDNGCYDNSAPVYFPEVAKKVCQPVLDGKAEKAIMFCGTGVGASIACNKIPGIRASMIHDVHCAHQAVEQQLDLSQADDGQMLTASGDNATYIHLYANSTEMLAARPKT